MATPIMENPPNHGRSNRKQLVLSWLAAPLSGVLLVMCFPDWNLAGLVWVWMLPLLPAIWRGQKKRYGFALAYLSGLVFWTINLKWLWTVSGLGALGLAAFLSLYFGVWGAIAVSLGNPWRRRNKTAKKSTPSESSIQKVIEKKQQGQASAGLLGGALTDSFTSLKFAFINAAAWVGLEWLRGWIFTGFAWNGLGVTFHQTPILAQAADLVGVTGLAFIPVFLSAVIIQTGYRLFQEAHTGKLKPRLDFGVAALLLALQFCYGVWKVQDIQAWKMQRVRVLLVQENIPQDVKWNPLEGAAIIQGYADSTTHAINTLEQDAEQQLRANTGETYEFKTPDLVIWPESAMPSPLLFADHLDGYLIYDDVRHMLIEEVRPLGHFTLIAGMNEIEANYNPTTGRAIPLQHGKMFNSIAIVPPKENIETHTQTYRKLHLVIFGEYIPFVKDLPFLKQLFKFSAGADFTGNFQAGNSTDPLIVSLPDSEIQLIPSVCFEDTVGRLTRKFVRQKPQLIVNVTNDGWFKQSEAAAQHMANAKFRAIELRRPMVRSANTGVSAIISVTGSVNDPETGERQVIENDAGSHFTRSTLYGHAYAPKNGPLTLYTLAGDWFAWLMIASVFAFSIKARLSKNL